MLFRSEQKCPDILLAERLCGTYNWIPSIVVMNRSVHFGDLILLKNFTASSPLTINEACCSVSTRCKSMLGRSWDGFQTNSPLANFCEHSYVTFQIENQYCNFQFKILKHSKLSFPHQPTSFFELL